MISVSSPIHLQHYKRRYYSRKRKGNTERKQFYEKAIIEELFEMPVTFEHILLYPLN